MSLYILSFCVFCLALFLLVSSQYVFSYHPFYFDFHSVCVIFDVSSGFYFWNVNRTPTWHLNRNFSAILATLQITSYVHSRNSSYIVYQNRNLFIPKIIVVIDLFKLSLNSYAAKDTICVLFFTKKTQNYRYRNYFQDDKNSI